MPVNKRYPISDRQNERFEKGTQASDLYVRVAWSYYKENQTQQEIAKKYDLSRSKVHRLLQKAKDKNIVNVEIIHPEVNLLSLEKNLVDKYDLDEALVVPFSSSEEKLKDSLGEAGAFYLRHKLPSFDSLGISIGSTLQKVAEHFFSTDNQIEMDTKVVALHGNLTGNIAVTPYSIGNVFAEKLQADFFNVWAPAIAEDKKAANVFRSEPWIEEVLSMAANVEVMLLGIGTLHTSATLFQELNYLTEKEIDELKNKGAVGDSLGQFFDAEGSPIDTQITERMIGVPLSKLRQRSGTVGIAGGPQKYKGILAALKGNYIKNLITDERTAERLIKETKS